METSDIDGKLVSLQKCICNPHVCRSRTAVFTCSKGCYIVHEEVAKNGSTSQAEVLFSGRIW